MKGKLEEAGMDTLAYDSQFGYYRVRIDLPVNDKQRDTLRGLIQQAWKGFAKV
jgi:hypothetical protein